MRSGPDGQVERQHVVGVALEGKLDPAPAGVVEHAIDLKPPALAEHGHGTALQGLAQPFGAHYAVFGLTAEGRQQKVAPARLESNCHKWHFCNFLAECPDRVFLGILNDTLPLTSRNWKLLH